MEELGWSMTDLAEKMGLNSRQAAFRIAGGVNNPSLTKSVAVAKALGVKLDYLIELGEAEMAGRSAEKIAA